MRVEVVADEEAAAARAAAVIADAGAEAAAEREPFSLAVSGGRTPWRMLALLADSEIPWPGTELFQVDERIAEPGSADRNLTHLLLALPISVQPSVRPMPVTSTDLDAAAREYSSALPERLDLIHLGLGPDGHTASLVPGDDVLDVSDRRVAITGGSYQGHRRMTLTYPTLSAARQVVWLVTGAEKQDALAKLLAADSSIPAGRVENDSMLLIADEAAGADSATTGRGGR